MKAARKLGYRSEVEMQQAESQEGLAQLRRAQRLATPLRQASQLLESTPDDPPSDRDASSSSTTRSVAPPAAPMLPSRPRIARIVRVERAGAGVIIHGKSDNNIAVSARIDSLNAEERKLFSEFSRATFSPPGSSSS